MWKLTRRRFPSLHLVDFLRDDVIRKWRSLLNFRGAPFQFVGLFLCQFLWKILNSREEFLKSSREDAEFVIIVDDRRRRQYVHTYTTKCGKISSILVHSVVASDFAACLCSGPFVLSFGGFSLWNFMLIFLVGLIVSVVCRSTFVHSRFNDLSIIF